MKPVFLENITNAICQNLLLFSALYVIYFLLKNLLQNKLSAKLYVSILLLFMLIGIVQFCYAIINGSQYRFFRPDNFITSDKFYNLSSIVPVLYLCFLGCLLVMKIFYFFTKKRLGDDIAPVTNSDLLLYLNELCAYLQIETPSIFISKKATVAYVKGFFKKSIIIPTAYFSQMSEAEIEAVFLHEIAHIKHWDVYTNWVIVITETLFYFNPFVKQFCKEIRLQRELACDDWVIEHMRPKEYALALQRAAQINDNNRQFHKIAFEVPKHQLFYRIKRLFDSNTKPKTYHFNFRPFIITAFFFGFLFFTDIQSYNNLEITQNKFSLAIPPTEIVATNMIAKNETEQKKPVIVISNSKANNEPAKAQHKISETCEVNNAGEVILIPVINKAEQTSLAVILTKNTSKVDDAVFSLIDSTVIYTNIISNQQFNQLVYSSLQKHLSLIASSLEENAFDMICEPETTVLNVTQNKGFNPFYNDVQLKTQLRYSQFLNKWIIDFVISNGQQLIASKLIDVTLLKKLREIKL